MPRCLPFFLTGVVAGLEVAGSSSWGMGLWKEAAEVGVGAEKGRVGVGDLAGAGLQSRVRV